MTTLSGFQQHNPDPTPPFVVRDLGTLNYADALTLQREALDRVVAQRENAKASTSSDPNNPLNPDANASGVGEVFLVEHNPPVLTLTRRAANGPNLLATPDTLAQAGVQIHETDRGGDITYHGPGQLVCYPIVDLNLLGLGLHGYMRLLEQAVIDTCAAFGVSTTRDPKATGVWVENCKSSGHPITGGKICAMGVRVRRWVTMHGLALNVTTNLDHFNLIIPCGLPGRSVTSIAKELGQDQTPSMSDVKHVLTTQLATLMTTAIRAHHRSPDRRH